MKRKRYSRQQCKKHLDGECLICKENSYELLDSHRLVEGAKGGKYHPSNIVVLCSLCHRRVHNNEVRFDRKYTTTDGRLLLHWWLGEVELWTPVLS